MPELAGLDPVERDQLATIFLGRARPYESDDGKPISFPSIHAWHQATARTERDVSQLFLR